VTATSVTVVWATLDSASAELQFALPGQPPTVVPAATTLFDAAYTGMAADYYQHEATATGLTPATTYSYDVRAGGAVVTPSTDEFTTAPAIGTGTVRFIVFGDSGSGGPEQQQLAALMAAESSGDGFDLALHTGDVVYPKGTHPLLQDRFFKVYETWLRRRPIFPAFGNHEEYVDKGQPYLDVFALPENGASALFPDHRERYYSFDYGPIHFISIDTQIAFSSRARLNEQLDWLARDLETTTQPWRIVYFHRPAYGSSDLFISDVRTHLRSILEHYGVQLVFAGHEHSYARGAPWREGSESSFPVVHIVSGGGGASLNTPGMAPWLASWNKAFHYIRANVTDCQPGHACEVSLEAVGADGIVFDSFALSLLDRERDAEVPRVSWIEPAADADISGKATLAGAAADDTDVVKVDVWIDGALRMIDDAAPYSWSWDTTKELNGPHVLELRATDIAGHQGVSESRRMNVENPAPTVGLLSPLAQDRAFTDLPYRIRWAAAAGAFPFDHARVELSTDAARTFTAVSECGSLPADARECFWNAPGPVAKHAFVRVSVFDTAGHQATATSAPFEIKSGATTLQLKNPDKHVAFGIGSKQSVFWSSGLSVGASLGVEISRDGGVSWTTVARPLLNSTKELRWTVTGPAAADALMRVSALNTPLEDVSSQSFRIEDPRLAVSLPGPGTVWAPGTSVRVKWTTNLGVYDRLLVRLSTDDGATFPIVLAGSVPASQPTLTVSAPTAVTTRARVRVEALDNAAWSATSPAFVIR